MGKLDINCIKTTLATAWNYTRLDGYTLSIALTGDENPHFEAQVFGPDGRTNGTDTWVDITDVGRLFSDFESLPQTSMASFLRYFE